MKNKIISFVLGIIVGFGIVFGYTKFFLDADDLGSGAMIGSGETINGDLKTKTQTGELSI